MIRCWHHSRSALLTLLAMCVPRAPAAHASHDARPADLQAPIAIYSHASISASLSPPKPVSEKQAMRDLDDLVRLKKAGLRFDYDVVDASMFAPAGSNRALRAQDWPSGPDAWIAACRASGIRPGLRIGSNVLGSMPPAPQWTASLDRNAAAMSLFEGGFLPGLMTVLDTWYGRGIRLFELGPVDLTAATPVSAAALTREQIVSRNSAALRDALQAFRRKNRDAVLLVLTNPAAKTDSSAHPSPSQDSPPADSDLRSETAQLGAFQVLLTGDPQLSSAPQVNLLRDLDIGNDGLVRRFEQQGVPLQHIHSAGFVIEGTSNSSLRVSRPGWKGTFLLAMARGGWVNSLHGNLRTIQGDDASWMARAQKLFLNLQAHGRIHSFGNDPGSGQPYGFAGATSRGSVCVVVNPGLAVAQFALPSLAVGKLPLTFGRIQFRDAGFVPRLRGNTIRLGPGQMAMVGYGAYAAPAYSFGVQQDVVIPNSIEPVDADFQATAPATIEASFDPPIEGVLRVVFEQRAPANQTLSSGDANAHPGETATPAFTLEVTQSGRPIPVRIDDREYPGAAAHSRPIWFAAEMDVNDLTPGLPVRVRFHSNLSESSDLKGSAFQVVY